MPRMQFVRAVASSRPGLSGSSKSVLGLSATPKSLGRRYPESRDESAAPAVMIAAFVDEFSPDLYSLNSNGGVPVLLHPR